MKKDKGGKNFFFLVLSLLAILTFYVLKPYIPLALLAIILVNLFYPLYESFYKLFRKRKGIASLFASLIVILFFLLPIFSILIFSARQALDFFRSAEDFVKTGDESLKRLVTLISSLDAKIPLIDLDFKVQNIQELVDTYGGTLAAYFSTRLFNMAANISSWLINSLIFFLVLLYLFPEKVKITEKILMLSPLPDKVDMLFLEKLPQTTKSVFKGTVLVALVQGFLGGFLFALIGIPAFVFWGLLMTLLSFIPVGAGIIWGPVGILLLLSGKIWQGALLLLWGVFVINSVDNILRPLLVGKETHMHPVLIFLSILGGLRLFGFLGFLYGPLIMVLFLTALEVYQVYYSKY